MKEKIIFYSLVATVGYVGFSVDYFLWGGKLGLATGILFTFRIVDLWVDSIVDAIRSKK